MPHPKRRAQAGTDTDATIEQLLLSGLDHYFAGRYEPAIHVWTRVLFLDRGHRRARAYIERARTAIAEQQRESEELLHGGIAAFDAGDSVRARQLLRSAIQRGGPDDVAVSLLARLDRLDAASGPPVARAATAPPTTWPASPPRVKSGAGRRATNWVLGTVTAAGLVAAGYVAADWARVERWLLPETLPESPGVTLPAPGLTTPEVPALAIERARGLLERGRLREALRALDVVRPDDHDRTEAEALRADIQRALLDRTLSGLRRPTVSAWRTLSDSRR